MNILTGQLDALARAFFVRFFESEITTGTDDLKQFFFWLLAALAIPGLFIPWIMAFDWQLLALIQGRRCCGSRRARRKRSIWASR